MSSRGRPTVSLNLDSMIDRALRVISKEISDIQSRQNGEMRTDARSLSKEDSSKLVNYVRVLADLKDSANGEGDAQRKKLAKLSNAEIKRLAHQLPGMEPEEPTTIVVVENDSNQPTETENDDEENQP